MASKQSWHTKEWKEKREKIIKDDCEWCGSTKGLCLHHQKSNKTLKYYAFRKSMERAAEHMLYDEAWQLDAYEAPEPLTNGSIQQD